MFLGGGSSILGISSAVKRLSSRTAGHSDRFRVVKVIVCIKFQSRNQHSIMSARLYGLDFFLRVSLPSSEVARSGHAL